MYSLSLFLKEKSGWDDDIKYKNTHVKRNGFRNVQWVDKFPSGHSLSSLRQAATPVQLVS